MDAITTPPPESLSPVSGDEDSPSPMQPFDGMAKFFLHRAPSLFNPLMAGSKTQSPTLILFLHDLPQI
jgi:hypothetical protein